MSKINFSKSVAEIFDSLKESKSSAYFHVWVNYYIRKGTYLNPSTLMHVLIEV